jgi:uncharacterized membrane protein
MSNSTKAASSSFPLFGILGLIFITLKLCGVINWSWWWVTAPFWGGLALVLGIFAIVGIIALIVAMSDRKPATPYRKR